MKLSVATSYVSANVRILFVSQTSAQEDNASTNHVVVGGDAEQPSERDDGRDAGEVEEDDGGEALQVHPVPDVRQVRFPVEAPPHVRDQPSKQPAVTHTTVNI